MFNVFVTNAVISKGFDGKPAIRLSENGGKTTAASFKIGKRVYDSRAENNQRYINIAVKAFAPVCDRIEKMKLKEGSFINVFGRLDEEKWDDDGQPMSRFVIIAEEVEYAGGKPGGNGTNGHTAEAAAPPPGGQPAQQQPPPGATAAQAADQGEIPLGFEGYTAFPSDEDDNPFYPNQN